MIDGKGLEAKVLLGGKPQLITERIVLENDREVFLSGDDGEPPDIYVAVSVEGNRRGLVDGMARSVIASGPRLIPGNRCGKAAGDADREPECHPEGSLHLPPPA